MLKIEEAFADFQYVGHKTLEITFKQPKRNAKIEELEIFVDYEIVHKKENEENYLGIVVYEVKIVSSDTDILYLELEGAFIGNKKTFNMDIFEEMLAVNGVAALSQIARLQIMNLTTNVGLKEPIVIPMINIMELNKKKNS